MPGQAGVMQAKKIEEEQLRQRRQEVKARGRERWEKNRVGNRRTRHGGDGWMWERQGTRFESHYSHAARL
jgi:hypothetical protein